MLLNNSLAPTGNTTCNCDIPCKSQIDIKLYTEVVKIF